MSRLYTFLKQNSFVFRTLVELARIYDNVKGEIKLLPFGTSLNFNLTT